jgi:uridylate kinase
MSKTAYKRILLKLSGEALAGAGKTGIDFDYVLKIGSYIKECVEKGVQIAIVVGGGNYWRGRSNQQMDRTRADRMGMMATVMNALALSDVFEQNGVDARVMTATPMPAFGETFTKEAAVRHLNKGRVVIFGAGSGNPYFTTDTAGVLRALEIEAEAILLAKNIDGVYSADPNKDPTAVKYDTITYDEMLAQHLAVMDTAATSIAMENNLPIEVFALKEPENIIRVVMGEKIGTSVVK